MIQAKLTLLATLLLCASLAHADLVVTKDGARLTGTITLIDQGVLHLKTAYAGDLKIQQDQIASFSTDDPVSVRLASGSTMSGPVTSGDGDTLRIRSEDGVLETDITRVTSGWAPDVTDPDQVRAEKAREALRMKWHYEAGFDLFGRDGNSEEFSLGANLKAVLKNKDNALTFYGLYEEREKNDEKTEDRLLGGSSFETFFSKVVGWYIRTELETDAIDEIDLRSTSATGLSYRLLNEDHHSLVLRSGLGYRYTAYDDGSDNESDPTLDFGLAHMYRFNDRYVLKNDLTYVPSLSDFGNYRIVQDSGLEIPVGTGDFWKIRMGLKNEYDSEAVSEEQLDTTYYTRMILNWN